MHVDLQAAFRQEWRFAPNCCCCLQQDPQVDGQVLQRLCPCPCVSSLTWATLLVKNQLGLFLPVAGSSGRGGIPTCYSELKESYG